MDNPLPEQSPPSTSAGRNSRRLDLLYVALVIAISGMLLLAAAQQKSFWEDEVFTAIFSQVSEVAQGQGLSWDVHPPLYLFLANRWGQVFGFDELGLRSLSILFTLAALALSYKLALDTLDETAALACVTLLAFSPLVIMYGHNARYYSLAAALALCVALMVVWFERTLNWVFLAGYIAAGVTFFYLLFGAASVLIAANLWFLARWALASFGRRQSASQAAAPSQGALKRWAGLAGWLLAQAAVLALAWPAVQRALAASQRGGDAQATSGLLVESIKRIAYFGFTFTLGETLSPFNPLAWLGGLAAAGTLLFALWAWRKNAGLWLHVGFFAVIFAINFALTFQGAVAETWQNLTYRIFFALPFLAAWLGAGLARLRPRLALLAGGLILAAYALGIFNYFTGREFIRPSLAINWPRIFNQVQTRAIPGAVVICSYGDSACGYYSKRAGFGGFGPEKWNELSGNPPAELWWLQTNLGRAEGFKNDQKRLLETIQQTYPQVQSTGYARQDPGIRWLKQRGANQEDYEYRLILYHFSRP